MQRLQYLPRKDANTLFIAVSVVLFLLPDRRYCCDPVSSLSCVLQKFLLLPFFSCAPVSSLGLYSHLCALSKIDSTMKNLSEVLTDYPNMCSWESYNSCR